MRKLIGGEEVRIHNGTMLVAGTPALPGTIPQVELRTYLRENLVTPKQHPYHLHKPTIFF